MMPNPKAKVDLNFVVSAEINNTLDLAQKTGGTKSEVFRRAIALMDVAVEAKRQGKKIGITENIGI